MSLTVRMKEQRKKLGMTQPDLAKALDMSLDSIKKMETGKMMPSVETLLKMGNLFNCSTDYLLGRTNDPKSVTWKHVLNVFSDISDIFDDPDKITNFLKNKFISEDDVLDVEDLQTINLLSRMVINEMKKSEQGKLE